MSSTEIIPAPANSAAATEAPPELLQDACPCEMCHACPGVRAFDQSWLCEACVQLYLEKLEEERWRA